MGTSKIQARVEVKAFRKQKIYLKRNISPTLKRPSNHLKKSEHMHLKKTNAKLPRLPGSFILICGKNNTISFSKVYNIPKEVGLDLDIAKGRDEIVFAEIYGKYLRF